MAPLQRQQQVKQITEVQPHTGADAARRLDADQTIKTIDRADHASTAKEVITHKERVLIDTVRSTINAGGVPTAKQIDTLKEVAGRMQAELRGDVESTVTKSRCFILTKNRSFTSITATRKELVQDKAGLQQQLAEAKRIAADPKLAAEARSSGTPADVKVRQLEGALQHVNNKLGAIDDKLRVKLANVGKVGEYMKSDKKHKEVLDVVTRDPVAALKVAGSGEATTALLVKIAEAHGQDPAIAKQLLGNAHLPDTAIQKLFAAAGGDKEILELVARNKNTPTDVLKQLAAGDHSDALLKDVAAHKNTSVETLGQLIDKPGAYDLTRAAALRRLPDIGTLSAARMTILDKGMPSILLTEIKFRCQQTTAGVDAAIKRPAALKLIAAASACDKQIGDLLKLKETAAEPGLKFALTKQIQALEKTRDRVQEPLNKMERGVALADALVGIKQQGYVMGKQADKFRTDQSETIRLTEAIHGDSVSLVKTMGRVERIRDDLTQDKDRTLALATKLHNLYQHRSGAGAAVEFLKFQADMLKSLTPDNAGAQIVVLKVQNPKFAAKLEQAVLEGKLSPSEKENLLAFSRSVEKAVIPYSQGMSAAKAHEDQIMARLAETTNKGMSSSIKVATELCSEVQQRLDFEHTPRLKLPYAIDPKYVEGLKVDAAKVFKTEVKPMMDKLLGQYSELLTRGTDKASKLIGEKARTELVEYLNIQQQKLDHFDNPALLAAIKEQETTLVARLQSKSLVPPLAKEDLALLDGLTGLKAEVDKALGSHEKFAGLCDAQIAKLNTSNSKVVEKVAFIEEVLKSGVASGGTEEYSLSISVNTPVPGLSVDARGGYTFSFQRNTETGEVEIIKQLEGGIGASYGTSGVKVSGEFLGGVQDKFSFKTPQQAAEFLHYVETGLPSNYKAPDAKKVEYGGFKASLEAGISKIAKVEGEASFIYASERRPDGTEMTTKKGSVGARIEVQLFADKMDMGTVAVPAAPGVGSPGSLGGKMQAVFTVEALVTHQTRSYYHHGVPMPDKDKTITDIEVNIEAGMDGKKLEGLLKTLVTAGSVAPDLLKELGVVDKEGSGFMELIDRLVGPLGGGD